jgi:probable HAF family extracellular repeat protein
MSFSELTDAAAHVRVIVQVMGRGLRGLAVSLSLVALVAGLVALTASSRVAARWVATDLGTLGGPGSYAVAMNERGQVVGAADTRVRYTPAQDAARAKLGMPVQQAFVWEKGTMGMRDLGVRFGGPGSWAVAINERGEVVGAAETKAVEESGHHATHAFLWQKGVVRDLGTLPGGTSSSAVAINDRGQVVGVSCSETGTACRAFIWQNGTLTDLGTLGGDDTQPVDINERGQIVGTATTGKMGANRSPIRHAFLWQDGKMTDLGTLGGPRSWASAINDRGQVVGQANTTAKSKGGSNPWLMGMPIAHAFLWQNGKMRDLGTLGGEYSNADAINAQGRVIGDTGGHAFLWRDGKTTDLGTLPEQTTSEAVAINERDQVVGTTYDDERTRSRAFLWQNGTMTELPSQNQGFPDSQAVAVNGNDQIVGQRWARTKPLHVARAVLWTLKP